MNDPICVADVVKYHESVANVSKMDDILLTQHENSDIRKKQKLDFSVVI